MVVQCELISSQLPLPSKTKNATSERPRRCSSETLEDTNLLDQMYHSKATICLKKITHKTSQTVPNSGNTCWQQSSSIPVKFISSSQPIEAPWPPGDSLLGLSGLFFSWLFRGTLQEKRVEEMHQTRGSGGNIIQSFSRYFFNLTGFPTQIWRLHQWGQDPIDHLKVIHRPHQQCHLFRILGPLSPSDLFLCWIFAPMISCYLMKYTYIIHVYIVYTYMYIYVNFQSHSLRCRHVTLLWNVSFDLVEALGTGQLETLTWPRACKSQNEAVKARKKRCYQKKNIKSKKYVEFAINAHYHMHEMLN